MTAPRRWIRLDVGWEESDWLAELSPGSRLAWVLLLGHVKALGIGGAVRASSVRALSRKWDIPAEEIEEMLAAARADEAIAVVDGSWIVAGWDHYQKPDVTAADRKRRQREREPHTPTASPKAQEASRGHDLSRRDSGADDVTRHATETLTLTETGTETTPVDRELPAPLMEWPAGQPDFLESFLVEHPIAREILAGLKHPGGKRATAATLDHRFLYPDDLGGLGDPVVRGLDLPTRKRLVVSALLEFRDQGEAAWERPLFAGFVRRLRDAEAKGVTAAAVGVLRSPPRPAPEPEISPEERIEVARLARETIATLRGRAQPVVSCYPGQP